MKYVGSKNRLSKELCPIIQSYINENTRGYLEPFVGGANMIDKIDCKKKIGLDIHEELIELLNALQNGWTVDVIAHIFNQMVAIADKERREGQPGVSFMGGKKVRKQKI